MHIDHEDGRTINCKPNGTSGVMLTLTHANLKVAMALRKDEAKILATALIEYSKG
jgi:hypothetical protein